MYERIVRAIAKSGLSIYDPLDNDPELFFNTKALEVVLDNALRGKALGGANRTRSKIANQLICKALGYPIPSTFKRTVPRFPGQNFDKYVQKADNLQIWNQKVEAGRRYVLIRPNRRDKVQRVRVVTGDELALLDKTGTLTHKYQARSRKPVTESHLASKTDTSHFRNIAKQNKGLLPISEIHKRLLKLVGKKVPDPGRDQERNRGGGLHGLISKQLGAVTPDSGQFPDIVDQVVEFKLQTAGTIDLGLVCPDHVDPILSLPEFRHCDARYAVFYGRTDGVGVTIEQVVVTTGEDFFDFFVRFEGKVKNAKLQIPLPGGFFD